MIFHHNAMVMFGNGDKAKLGSITSKWEHFHEWKRLDEVEPGVRGHRRRCSRACATRIRFMDLVTENFILFDRVSRAGAKENSEARNHQFLGVNRGY